MVTPLTSTAFAFMVPPVVVNALTVEASAFTVLKNRVRLLLTVAMLALFALLLTIDASDVNSVNPPFPAIVVEIEFTKEVSAFVDNTPMIELAKLGLLPSAAAISTSVFKWAGAPFNRLDIFPSKYEVVAFVVNSAERADTLDLSAESATCSDVNDNEIALNSDPVDAMRFELSEFNAVLSEPFTTSRAATEPDIALKSEMIVL